MRRLFVTRHWKTIVILAATGLLGFQIILLLTSEATTAAIVETERINGEWTEFTQRGMVFSVYRQSAAVKRAMKLPFRLRLK